MFNRLYNLATSRKGRLIAVFAFSVAVASLNIWAGVRVLATVAAIEIIDNLTEVQ
jgi:hypothetical protein